MFQLNKTVFLFVIVAFGIAATPARSNMIPEFSIYLADQLEKEDAAIQSCSTDPEAGYFPGSPDAGPDKEAWFFRRIFLRIRPRLSYGIPHAVNLEIVPEVELLWEKPLPSGWTGYKPHP